MVYIHFKLYRKCSVSKQRGRWGVGGHNNINDINFTFIYIVNIVINIFNKIAKRNTYTIVLDYIFYQKYNLGTCCIKRKSSFFGFLKGKEGKENFSMTHRFQA